MRRITASAIKALKVTGSRHTSRDQNVEIRVGANGSVAIDFYFKDKGRTGREKLLRLRSRDSVRAVEIAVANERLAELRHDLALGVTPIVASKKIKAASVRVTAAKVIERKNAPTVARLARDYEAIHLPTLKHDTRRNYSQMLRDYVIPSLGPELLAEVNRGLLVSLLDGEKRPATKAALRRLLGGLFTFAVERELIPASPAFKLTKVAPDVRPRQRILQPKEFKGFWASADNVSRFLLATGQRVDEVAGMQWTDLSVPVDGNHGWLNRDPKLGQQVLIPLSDLAYSLLPQERDGDMVWGCHKDTLSHRVAAISDATKGERFTAHDLRRTAATHWTALGGGDVRERLLNHATPGLEGTYNLYGFEDEKRNTMALWGEFILSSIE